MDHYLVATTVTDSNGWAYYEALGVGSYTIEVDSDSLGAMIQYERTNEEQLDTIPKVIVKPKGQIQGTIQLPAGVDYAWVQIFGVNRLVKTNSIGQFTIEDLPESVYHIRAIVSESSQMIAADYVKVVSGLNLDLGTLPEASPNMEDPQTWRYSKWIFVDSLFSDWMLPIENESVGFLRLDSTNFNFEEAMENGQDIRFYHSNGEKLVYQIAYWNQDLKSALIRVRVKMGSLQDLIQISWGCEGALNVNSPLIWEGVAASELDKSYRLLVEDFEEKSLKSNLLPPISPHSWYLIPQDSTVIIDPLPVNALDAFTLAGSIREGYAFHIGSSGSTYKWALFGLKLDTIPKNLEHIDSVVFWVRGNGIYHFALESFEEDGGKAVFVDTLELEWTRVRVRPIDFVAGDSVGGNVGWEIIKNQITNMSFFAFGDIDFWLDDVTLFGINRDDLK